MRKPSTESPSRSIKLPRWLLVMLIPLVACAPQEIVVDPNEGGEPQPTEDPSSTPELNRLLRVVDVDTLNDQLDGASITIIQDGPDTASVFLTPKAGERQVIARIAYSKNEAEPTPTLTPTPTTMEDEEADSSKGGGYLSLKYIPQTNTLALIEGVDEEGRQLPTQRWDFEEGKWVDIHENLDLRQLQTEIEELNEVLEEELIVSEVEDEETGGTIPDLVALMTENGVQYYIYGNEKDTYVVKAGDITSVEEIKDEQATSFKRWLEETISSKEKLVINEERLQEIKEQIDQLNKDLEEAGVEDSYYTLEEVEDDEDDVVSFVLREISGSDEIIVASIFPTNTNQFTTTNPSGMEIVVDPVGEGEDVRKLKDYIAEILEKALSEKESAEHSEPSEIQEYLESLSLEERESYLEDYAYQTRGGYWGYEDLYKPERSVEFNGPQLGAIEYSVSEYFNSLQIQGILESIETMSFTNEEGEAKNLTVYRLIIETPTRDIKTIYVLGGHENESHSYTRTYRDEDSCRHIEHSGVPTGNYEQLIELLEERQGDVVTTALIFAKINLPDKTYQELSAIAKNDGDNLWKQTVSTFSSAAESPNDEELQKNLEQLLDSFSIPPRDGESLEEIASRIPTVDGWVIDSEPNPLEIPE